MHAITEHELARLLGGEAVEHAAGREVVCQGVNIGNCSENGFLDRLRCQQKRHNEEGLNEITASWSSAVRKLYLKAMESPCPACGGTGYIEARTREGKMLSMSALVFCRYGGIELPLDLCKQLIRGAE